MPLLNYTTKVDVYTTLGAIQGQLVKHGAKKIMQEYDDAGHITALSGPIGRRRDLLQAEKDGRLVVLPCKVGDIVYQLDYMTHSEALKSGVPQSRDPHQNRKYARKRAEYLPLIVREKKMVKSLFREFGKTVFLTRAEAEAALAKLEAHNE